MCTQLADLVGHNPMRSLRDRMTNVNHIQWTQEQMLERTVEKGLPHMALKTMRQFVGTPAKFNVSHRSLAMLGGQLARLGDDEACKELKNMLPQFTYDNTPALSSKMNEAMVQGFLNGKQVTQPNLYKKLVL